MARARRQAVCLIVVLGLIRRGAFGAQDISSIAFGALLGWVRVEGKEKAPPTWRGFEVL